MTNNSKITILGTVSEILEVKKDKTSAGIILETDNTQILIDPGIGTIVRANQANIDLKKTKIVLCSNNNLVFNNDLNAAIEFTDKDIHVICTTENLNHKNLKIIQVTEDKSTHIKNTDIEAYKYDEDLAFKLTTPKFVLGYIRKAKYNKQLIERFSDTNIFIIHLAVLKKEKNNHLSIEEIQELIQEINPELVILTGFSKKTLDADPLDISRNMKLQLNKKIQVLPAKELMTINPDNYNVVLKQKKLKGFME